MKSLRCRSSPKIGVLHQHLLKKLDFFLDLNLARLKCLTLLISGLLRHRTVNLARIDHRERVTLGGGDSS